MADDDTYPSSAWALFVAMHPGRTSDVDSTASELQQTNERDSPVSGEDV